MGCGRRSELGGELGDGRRGPDRSRRGSRPCRGGEEGGEEVGDTTSDIGRAALGDGWGNTTRATGHAAKPAIFVVYEKANPHSRYNVPVNRGAEASAYLKYVLDHYDGLPRWSFFVHGNESSWHHDGKLGERLAHAWRLARDTGRPYRVCRDQ